MAYSPLDPWLRLNQILCVEETRNIARDQTLSWKGDKYIVDGGNISLAGYGAIFRTDLRGKVRAFVMGNEVSSDRETAQPQEKGDSRGLV